MKVVSTNIAEPTTIIWNGKEEVTGIYKTPINEAILLLTDHVKNDEVSDRKHHGGEFKACYLFSEDHYKYWQSLYPNLKWRWGMFGENLTVAGLNEKDIYIGSIYKLGDAIVQITQPREPCYKLGIKFGDQNIIKQFIDHGLPGTYVRILKTGEVKTNDVFELIDKPDNSLTTAEFYKLLFSKEKDPVLIKKVIANDALPESKRNKLKKFL